MFTLRRSLTLIALTFALVAALAVPAMAGTEGAFVAKINASRAANGLAPLQVYGDLVDDARAHSAAMMAKGQIYHNPSLASVTSGWDVLGENVGVGPTVTDLHSGFMNSPSHRANILGDYNYVGVGVATEDDGTIWVTVVFMKASFGQETTTTTTAPLPPVTSTTTVAPAPSTSTTTTVAPTPSTTTTTSVASGRPSTAQRARMRVDTTGPKLIVAYGRTGVSPIPD